MEEKDHSGGTNMDSVYEDNYLKKLGCETVDGNQLAQYKDQWHSQHIQHGNEHSGSINKGKAIPVTSRGGP
jgi:hypothetical protein